MQSIDKIKAFREAGIVRRAHTFPYIGEYNIGMHCYNCLSMLFVLHPEPSQQLVKALLWHDVPERWTGDVPSPAKWNSPLLKSVLDSLEERIFQKLEIYDIFQQLTQEELNWMHAIDLLELYLWTYDQIAIGNKEAWAVHDRILKLFKKQYDDTPPEVWKIVETYKWERQPECDEFLAE